MELQATQAPCLSPVSDFDDAVLGKPTWLPVDFHRQCDLVGRQCNGNHPQKTVLSGC